MRVRGCFTKYRGKSIINALIVRQYSWIRDVMFLKKTREKDIRNTTTISRTQDTRNLLSRSSAGWNRSLIKNIRVWILGQGPARLLPNFCVIKDTPLNYMTHYFVIIPISLRKRMILLSVARLWSTFIFPSKSSRC